MKAMYLSVEYLGMRARSLGRAIFRNDMGALTLEWIVIAVALVVAATAAGIFIKNHISAEEKKMR